MAIPADLSQGTNSTPINTTNWNAIITSINNLKDHYSKGSVYDVTHPDYGAHGNGTDDDRDHINTAQTAAGVGKAIYFPPGTYKISSNITLSSDVIFANGAKLSIDNTKVVTITGAISAPLQQIISGLGTVSFTGNYKIHEVYPEWWGAAGDGVTEDAPEIQLALNTLRPVKLAETTYLSSTVLSNYGEIYGVGKGSILKQGTSDNSMINLKTGNCAVHDITLLGVTTTLDTFKYAIINDFATLPTSIKIYNVNIIGVDATKGFTGGIYLVGVQNAIIEKNRIRNIYGVQNSNAIFLNGNLIAETAPELQPLTDATSASDLVLPVTYNLIHVTGTTTINTINETTNSNPNNVIVLQFEDVCTLTHSANISLIGGVNFTSEAEFSPYYTKSFVILQKVSTGVWKQVAHNPQTCNYCVVKENDIEFTEDAEDTRRGYCGIVIRSGGTGNIIEKNTIKHGIQGISIVSTTTFLDKNNGAIIRGNVLDETYARDGSGHNYQESGIEIGGWCDGCIVTDNYIKKPTRQGIWYSNDGTNSATRNNIISHNTIQESGRHGIVVIEAFNSIISENIITNAGMTTANTYDGIYISPQPVAASLGAEDLIVKKNIIIGTQTRYGIHIYTSGGYQANRVRHSGNIIDVYGNSINDTGRATRRIDQVSDAPYPFTNEVSGHVTSNDNTLTSVMTVTVPNKTLAGKIIIEYFMTSNTACRVSSGVYHVTFGRVAGQNTGLNGVIAEADSVALAGGTEAHTSAVISLSAVAGGATAIQTFDVQCRLNSDQDVSSHFNFWARLVMYGYLANDKDAEWSIVAL